MKPTTFLPAAAAFAAGYVLGTAAGHERYGQITAALGTLTHHPKVQQVVFDLAGQARDNARRVPGPAADLIDNAANQVQEALTQPEHASANVGPTADQAGADRSIL